MFFSVPVENNNTTKTTTTIKPQAILLKSNSTVIKTLDTTKGVITRDLYGSGGHIDLPAICQDEGENIKILIIITSAPTHRDMRLSIRYCQQNFTFALHF